MTDAEVLKGLRAWIYLRAPVADWARLGVTERAVLRTGSREHLVLAAMTTVIHHITGKEKAEARKEFRRLIGELIDLGLSIGELQRASEILFGVIEEM
jgi:hypothetical protein